MRAILVPRLLLTSIWIGARGQPAPKCPNSVPAAWDPFRQRQQMVAQPPPVTFSARVEALESTPNPNLESNSPTPRSRSQPPFWTVDSPWPRRLTAWPAGPLRRDRLGNPATTTRPPRPPCHYDSVASSARASASIWSANSAASASRAANASFTARIATPAG